MSKTSIYMKNIYQKDNHTFTIEWSDSLISDYRLSDLQKNCPCAACVDEMTGKKLIDETTIDTNVKASRVVSVGRYALQVDFTSGCSMGIYDFELLRRI